MTLGIDILGRLETSVDIMQSVTSFNYLMSWYEENAECFEGKSLRPDHTTGSAKAIPCISCPMFLRPQ